MMTASSVVREITLPLSLVDRAMSFQPPALLIERFVRDHGVTQEEAREQFEEIKKFLVVCASNRLRSFAPSKRLDDMWHTFVLFTPHYVRFCEMLGGYIHHRPTREVMHGPYANTVEALPLIFGSIDEKWWKIRAAADCSSNCKGDDYCDDSPDCRD